VLRSILLTLNPFRRSDYKQEPERLWKGGGGLVACLALALWARPEALATRARHAAS